MVDTVPTWVDGSGGGTPVNAANLNQISTAIRDLQGRAPVNSLDYGAVGDGVTDDTTALRAALTAMDSAGHGFLDLQGRQYVTGKLSLPPQLGIGNGELILKSGTNDYILDLVGSASRTQWDWRVENLTLVGNSAANPTMPGAIHARAVTTNFDRPLLRNIRIIDCLGKNIHFESAGPSLIQPRLEHITIDSKSLATGTIGLFIGANVYDISATSVDIGRCGTGLRVENTVKQRFEDLRTWGCNIGVDLDTVEYLTFVNCEIDGNWTHGLRTASALTTHFTGCAFTNNALTDAANNLGFGTSFGASNANTYDGAYVGDGSNLFFTASRFLNEGTSTSDGGQQRYGINVPGTGFAVVTADCLFKNNRTGNVGGTRVNEATYRNGARLADQPSLTQFGFFSDQGPGMEMYDRYHGSRPGQYAFVFGGKDTTTGSAGFIFSDGSGGFTTVLAVQPDSVFIGNVAAAPATPSGGGVLYVQSGALKYKGSSGTVTTLGPA